MVYICKNYRTDASVNNWNILIQFRPGTYIDVEGTIEAIGNQNYQILFTERITGNGSLSKKPCYILILLQIYD